MSHRPAHLHEGRVEHGRPAPAARCEDGADRQRVDAQEEHARAEDERHGDDEEQRVERQAAAFRARQVQDPLPRAVAVQAVGGHREQRRVEEEPLPERPPARPSPLPLVLDDRGARGDERGQEHRGDEQGRPDEGVAVGPGREGERERGAPDELEETARRPEELADEQPERRPRAEGDRREEHALEEVEEEHLRRAGPAALEDRDLVRVALDDELRDHVDEEREHEEHRHLEEPEGEPQHGGAGRVLFQQAEYREVPGHPLLLREPSEILDARDQGRHVADPDRVVVEREEPPRAREVRRVRGGEPALEQVGVHHQALLELPEAAEPEGVLRVLDGVDAHDPHPRLLPGIVEGVPDVVDPVEVEAQHLLGLLGDHRLDHAAVVDGRGLPSRDDADAIGETAEALHADERRIVDDQEIEGELHGGDQERHPEARREPPPDPFVELGEQGVLAVGFVGHDERAAHLAAAGEHALRDLEVLEVPREEALQDALGVHRDAHDERDREDRPREQAEDHPRVGEDAAQDERDHLLPAYRTITRSPSDSPFRISASVAFSRPTSTGCCTFTLPRRMST